MRTHLERGPSIVWLAALAMLLAQCVSVDVRQARHEGGGDRLASDRLSTVRIPFVANSGQADPAVAYYAATFAGTVFVTRDGQIVYSLPGRTVSTSGDQTPAGGGWSLTETAVGGTARPTGGDPASTRVSYFLGEDPARWKSGLPTFAGISLGEVWPGISLDLRARGRTVEKLFTIEPGADPSRIRMSVAGARSLRVDDSGALVVGTGLGQVTFTPPVAFQEREGARHAVRVAYEVRGSQYRFRLDSYDRTLPVVIDPLLQATYLGGSGDEWLYALAIHPASGDVYVAGQTNSADFPGTTGGAQSEYRGFDAFVARLTADLTTLTQATYLGGSLAGGTEAATALAFHPTAGDVYVAGTTSSADFPGTTGGAQPAKAGGVWVSDAFVARLTADLTTLTQATYLGGSGSEERPAVAIHPTSGDVYVAGATESTDFPATTGGAQPTYGGGYFDAFVARLSADLTGLTQATYLGGSEGYGDDRAYALAVHPTYGDVYVAGATNSYDFPGTTGGAQPALAVGAYVFWSDAFVARLTADLTSLTQATYLGGHDSDFANALAIHPTSGDVYVAGRADSADFPGTTGGAQSERNGDDAFLARLAADLTTLTQATYLGGSGGDEATALAIHPTSGDVYVAGRTDSTDFPATTGGAQPAYGGGGSDAFAARLTADLATLVQATYLGGTGEDGGALGYDRLLVFAIHPTSGDVYVAGRTDSTDFPATTGGAQAEPGGGQNDAFVARLTADLASVPGADLTLSALSTPATAIAPGKSFALSNTVWNRGSAAADRFVIAYHLSADATYGGPDDITLSKTRAVTSLAVGATNAATTTLTVPASTPLGAYYVCAMADKGAVVPELDETNNSRCTAATITVARPDLRLTQILPDAYAFAGGTLSVASTVANEGGLSAGGFAITFRLSYNTIYGDDDDFVLSPKRQVDSLPAGASSSATTTLTIPLTTHLGIYVCAKVDSGGAVAEADESNNALCSASTVSFGRPDLAMAALSTATTAVAPGGSLKLSNTVTNPFNGTANPFVVGFHLSPDPYYDAAHCTTSLLPPENDIPLATRSVSWLLPGESSTATTTLTVPAATPLGTYSLVACADAALPGGVVQEADETNNARTGPTITVTRPDLLMTQVQPNAGSASAGGTLSVTSAVLNQGAVQAGSSLIAFRLSLNTIYGDGDDVVISTKRSVASLAPGAASPTGATSLAIPSTTPAGTYYVCAQADSNDAVTETDEGNNTLCSGATVTVSPPDLTMTALSTTTTTAAPGGSVKLSNKVKNQGGAAAGSFDIAFHLSADPAYGGADDIPFVATRSVSSLGSGTASLATTTLTVPAATPPGTYYICAQADSGGAVTENDEGNNTLCSSSTVTVP